MNFLKNNLWEIKKSTGLRIFGGLLCLTHFLSYWSWFRNGKIPSFYNLGFQPICWSLFNECKWMGGVSQSLWEIIFHTFGFLSILTLFVFFFTRFISIGWVLLLILLLFKSLLYIQDIRLSSNIHYILFILNFAYLFLPCKAHVLRWLLVSYYVAVGLLKMSPNWLTGQWFVDQLHIPIKLGEWFAAMSVVIEMLAPVALFFKNIRHFMLAYITIFIYHCLIWYAGGFTDSAILLCLLQIFPLLYFEELKQEREYLYQSFIRPEPSKVWVFVSLILFWSIQSLPFFYFRESIGFDHLKSHLTLSPIAANEDCEQSTFLVYKDYLEEVVMTSPQDRPSTFRCNPYLLFLDLKSVCREKSQQADFKTVSSYLLLRGYRDHSYRLAFQNDDFCSENVTFKSLLRGQNGI
ncbi:MAG: hypothetical protein K1X29_06265 [Bdellovibrionales bacterium]|nr:hypothetical protein [Bdellovibrionales bacterium]